MLTPTLAIITFNICLVTRTGAGDYASIRSAMAAWVSMRSWPRLANHSCHRVQSKRTPARAALNQDAHRTYSSRSMLLTRAPRASIHADRAPQRASSNNHTSRRAIYGSLVSREAVRTRPTASTDTPKVAEPARTEMICCAVAITS